MLQQIHPAVGAPRVGGVRTSAADGREVEDLVEADHVTALVVPQTLAATRAGMQGDVAALERHIDLNQLTARARGTGHAIPPVGKLRQTLQGRRQDVEEPSTSPAPTLSASGPAGRSLRSSS